MGATGRAGLSSSWLGDDAAAPQVSDRVPVVAAARRQQRVSATRARADDPGLAVAGRLRQQPLASGLQVGYDAVVGHAALGADLSGDVIGMAVPVPAVQVRADDGVTVPGEPVGELAVELVPAWHVVHGHDAGRDCVAGGSRHVGVNRVTVATGIRDDLGRDAQRRVGGE